MPKFCLLYLLHREGYQKYLGTSDKSKVASLVEYQEKGQDGFHDPAPRLANSTCFGDFAEEKQCFRRARAVRRRVKQYESCGALCPLVGSVACRGRSRLEQCGVDGCQRRIHWGLGHFKQEEN